MLARLFFIRPPQEHFWSPAWSFDVTTSASITSSSSDAELDELICESSEEDAVVHVIRKDNRISDTYAIEMNRAIPNFDVLFSTVCSNVYYVE